MPTEVGEIMLEQLFPEPDPYITDPVAWVRDELGEELWSRQREILESVRDNRFTAVKACHGPGKSFSAARAATWWNSVHPLGSAFVVSTAPSWPQIEAILWRELRRAHRKGNLRGRVTLDCKWHMAEDGGKRADASEELIAMGRKPADYDEQAFQGIHARYVLVIIDEADGVPEQLYNAVLSLVTNEHCRVLAIGNPMDPTSHFAEVCKPGSGWNVITIPVWDTPNFTEKVCQSFNRHRELPEERHMITEEMREVLVGPLWVETAKKSWGEGSPLWLSKVEAEFPEVTDDTLFTPRMILDAQARNLPGFERGRFAADIARFGDDETVLYRNRGGQIRLEERGFKQDTMETAGMIAKPLNELLKNQVVVPAIIDADGLGAGVYDRLREQGYEVGAFHGGKAAFDKTKFKNRRAEQYWRFREMFEADLIDLDPEDEQLAAQLLSIRWFLDSTGRIQLESKDDMRKRGLPSPDRADAAMMSTVDTGLVGLVVDVIRDSSLTSDLLRRKL